MNTGSYDTNRLFTTDAGPSCYSCPKCDCGEYELDDTWYVEFQDYYDLRNDQATCMQCTCMKDYNDNLYADCDYNYDSYDIGDKTCNVNTGTGDDDEYSCHSQESTSGLFSTIIN